MTKMSGDHCSMAKKYKRHYEVGTRDGHKAQESKSISKRMQKVKKSSYRKNPKSLKMLLIQK